MLPPSLHGLVQSARRIIEDGQQKGLCQVCFEVVLDGTPHTCDPEERANALTKAALLGWLPGASPTQRAKGYGVR